MIVDKEQTINFITDWIKNYAAVNNKRALVVGLSGGVDSALTALLCQRTGIETICCIVECDSHPASIDIAKNFAKDFNLRKLFISAEHYKENLLKQNSLYEIMPNDYKLKPYLQHAIINGVTDCLNGLNVGTFNRLDYRMRRFYGKHTDGSVDLAPLADLYKSEVYVLFEHLAFEGGQYNVAVRHGDKFPDIKLSAEDIYLAKPNRDTYATDEDLTTESEMGFTFKELEWADQEDSNYFIISNDPSPTSHYNWIRYTGRQKEIIAKLHQIEKATRHKSNPNLPICFLRKERFIR